MSGGVVNRHAVSIVNRLNLPPPALEAVLSSLRASHANSQFLYQAGLDAGLERGVLLDRAATILIACAAVNVTDDIADGDCTYLPRPIQEGPTSEWVLIHLFYAGLARLALPLDVIESISNDLVTCGGAQFVELATRQWDLELNRSVAIGFAARQFAAYLRLLWHGTPLAAPIADAVGHPLGIAIHLSADIATGDRRFTTLLPKDRQTLAQWGLDTLDEVARHRIPSVDILARSIIGPLEKAANTPG